MLRTRRMRDPGAAMVAFSDFNKNKKNPQGYSDSKQADIRTRRDVQGQVNKSEGHGYSQKKPSKTGKIQNMRTAGNKVHTQRKARMRVQRIRRQAGKDKGQHRQHRQSEQVGKIQGKDV